MAKKGFFLFSFSIFREKASLIGILISIFSSFFWGKDNIGFLISWDIRAIYMQIIDKSNYTFINIQKKRRNEITWEFWSNISSFCFNWSRRTFKASWIRQLSYFIYIYLQVLQHLLSSWKYAYYIHVDNIKCIFVCFCVFSHRAALYRYSSSRAITGIFLRILCAFSVFRSQKTSFFHGRNFFSRLLSYGKINKININIIEIFYFCLFWTEMLRL